MAAAKRQLGFVGARLGQGQHGRAFFIGMLLTGFLVVGGHFGYVSVAAVYRE